MDRCRAPRAFKNAKEIMPKTFIIAEAGVNHNGWLTERLPWLILPRRQGRTQ